MKWIELEYPGSHGSALLGADTILRTLLFSRRFRAEWEERDGRMPFPFCITLSLGIVAKSLQTR